MQYRKLMQNKPAVTKKVAEAPKMVKPGTTKAQASEREQMKKEKARLKQSGRVADAAAIFERFI
jgi:alpha-beta hydrolase superfamily lysophospholipase